MKNKKSDLYKYVTILILPLFYLVILGTAISMKKYVHFYDFTVVIQIYIIGLMITYFFSITLMISIIKNNCEIKNRITRLIIYHLPSFLTFLFSLYVVVGTKVILD
ncbi:hypothetical protein RJG79_00720 [Mycoplasmatota bacterium WC44]